MDLYLVLLLGLVVLLSPLSEWVINIVSDVLRDVASYVVRRI